MLCVVEAKENHSYWTPQALSLIELLLRLPPFLEISQFKLFRSDGSSRMEKDSRKTFIEKPKNMLTHDICRDTIQSKDDISRGDIHETK